MNHQEHYDASTLHKDCWHLDMHRSVLHTAFQAIDWYSERGDFTAFCRYRHCTNLLTGGVALVTSKPDAHFVWKAVVLRHQDTDSLK